MRARRPLEGDGLCQLLASAIVIGPAQHECPIVARTWIYVRAAWFGEFSISSIALLAVGTGGVGAADGVLPEAVHGDRVEGFGYRVDAQSVGVTPLLA